MAGVVLAASMTTPGAAADGAPTLVGTVVHRAPGPPATEPVAGVRVDAVDLSGAVVGTDVTDGTGTYGIDLAAGQYRVRFSDGAHVPEWSAGAVQVVADQSVAVDALLQPGSPAVLLGGFSDGSMRLDAALTRAQFVALAWRLVDQPPAGRRAWFRDVSRDRWFVPALDWAAGARVVSRYADGTFRPRNTVSRQQFVSGLRRVGLAVADPSAPERGITRGEALALASQLTTDPRAWRDWTGPLPHTVRFEEIASTFFADDFERSDRALQGDLAPTGERWSSYGFTQTTDPTNEGRILDGAVITPHMGASYNWVELARVPDEVTLRYTFEPGTSSGAAAGVMVSKLGAADVTTGMQIAQNSVHVAVGPWGTVIALYGPGYPMDAVYVRGFDQKLATDGTTEHTITLRRSGDTITVTNADGSVGIFSDPRVSALWGSTVLIEPYRPLSSYPTDEEPRIEAVQATEVRR